jgi:hypothetical protein
MLPAGPQAMRIGAEESEARVVMLHKQGGLFRIIVQNPHEKVSDRFDTRGAEILTPASVGKEFCSETSRHHHRPSGAYGLAQGITGDEADQIVMPLTLTCSSPSPRPMGLANSPTPRPACTNTMQVRQARDYVVHRPALRASLPGAPEPSPDPHLLLVAKLRAPLLADPARTPGNRLGAGSGSPISAAPAETA